MRRPAEAALVAVLAIGALSVVITAPEAPRPVLRAIPTVPPLPGDPSTSGTDAGRTPASRGTSAGSPELRGRASWYGTSGLVAAAGPGLRRALGREWRGQRVLVCAGSRCVLVALTDWCECYRGTSDERVIDLSSAAFIRLAHFTDEHGRYHDGRELGKIAVRIGTIRVALPATDTD